MKLEAEGYPHPGKEQTPPAASGREDREACF